MSKLIGYDFGSPFRTFQNTSSGSTNSTTVTYLSGVLVTKNTFFVGDVVRMYGMFEKIGANGGYDVRFYWNTTNDLSGTPTLIGVLSATTTTASSYNLLRRMTISLTTGSNTIVFPTNNTSTANDFSPVGDRQSFINIDWTVDGYFIAAANCGSSSDSIIIRYIKVVNG
jgi:hypothetical protein